MNSYSFFVSRNSCFIVFLQTVVIMPTNFIDTIGVWHRFYLGHVRKVAGIILMCSVRSPICEFHGLITQNIYEIPIHVQMFVFVFLIADWRNTGKTLHPFPELLRLRQIWKVNVLSAFANLRISWSNYQKQLPDSYVQIRCLFLYF